MKFRSYVLVFLAAFAGSLFLASCLNEDNKIPPNCFDGCKNNGEEEIDCGGPCEKKCDHCINGRWDPGIEFGETWVDCGGPDCPPCPSCSNGILDPNETGIDCGSNCGPCSSLCGDGLLNGHETAIDCVSDTLYKYECEMCPTCDDEVINGFEAGIDCGDPNALCPPCISSGNCTNGVTDGAEFWIDCGGPSCYACTDTLGYRTSANSPIVYTPSDQIDATFNGLVFNVLGETTDNGSFELNIGEPNVGWLDFPDGGTFTLGPTAPVINTAFIKYTNSAGIVFNTNSVGGSGTITIVKFATEFNNLGVPVNFFRLTYSGVLKSTNGAIYNIANGLIMVSI